jgi:hypothetical protein
MYPNTVPDELRERLEWTASSLEWAATVVTRLRDGLADPDTVRLARRRQVVELLDPQNLDMLGWLLGEAGIQTEELASALGPLLEPIHDGRYGHRYGIYAKTPFDGSWCGTPSGYGRHWRRGLPACAACKKAVANYNRDQRWLRRYGKTLIDLAATA